MGTERADLGFDTGLDSFDLDEWQPKPKSKERPTKARQSAEAAAKATGFKSREAADEAPRPKQRRRTTGRNRQFNIKARADTIEKFYAVADAQDWGLGETLEHAVELLEKKYLPKG